MKIIADLGVSDREIVLGHHNSRIYHCHDYHS